MYIKIFLKKIFIMCVISILLSSIVFQNATAGIGGGTTIGVGNINYAFLVKYVDMTGKVIDDSINYEGSRTGSGDYAPEVKTINGYTYEGYYYYDSYGSNAEGSLADLLESSSPKIQTEKDGKDSKDGVGTYTVFMVYREILNPQTYHITYNQNNGTGTLTDPRSPYAKNSKAIVLDGGAFSREHYDFVSWNTKANGTGDIYHPGDEIEMNTNITLYAQWKIIQYTLTYDANAGSGNVPDAEIYDVDTKGVVKEKGNLSKSNATFEGWNTKANGTGETYQPGDEIEMSKSMTLYAQWKTIRCTLTYDANTGSGNVPDSETYDADAKAVIKEKGGLSKGNATFEGWNTKADGTGDAYQPGNEIEINENMTLYAQWKTIQYTLTYDANTGSGNVPDAEIYDVDAKAVIKEKGSLSKSNSTFKGWNTKADGTGDAYQPGNEIEMNANITLYAQWKSSAIRIIDKPTPKPTQTGGAPDKSTDGTVPVTNDIMVSETFFMTVLLILSILGLIITVNRKIKIKQ